MLSSEYSVTLTCELLDCAKSSYYHQAEPPDDTKLRAAIDTVSAEWPTYGYRRITAQLRRQGWQVNHKRIRRLMQKLDLSIKPKRKKRQTTDSQHDFPRYPNLVLDLDTARPDQVWVSDITYIRLLRGFVYRSAELTAKPGSDHGRIHPLHPGLASAAWAGSHPDPDRSTASAGQAPCTRDSSL
jgi:hypothetical protein